MSTKLQTEQEALLAAIRECPEDDTPRLVYADWLQENIEYRGCPNCAGCGTVLHSRRRGLGGISNTPVVCPKCHGTGRVSNGHGEHAEFIRLQCKLAKLRPCKAGLNDDDADDSSQPACGCEWHTLRRRVMLTGFKSDLPVLPLPGGIRRWRRGFATFAWCSWSVWQTHHAAILAHPDVVLEEVRLTTWPHDDWVNNRPFLVGDPQAGISGWIELQPGETAADYASRIPPMLAQHFPGHCPNHPLKFTLPAVPSQGGMVVAEVY